VALLSFAAVELHGREWWTRAASRALVLALAAVPALAQTLMRDPRDGAAPGSVALAVRTLIIARHPILDVAEAADRLIVLGPDTIAIYPRAEALLGAPPAASAVVTHAQPWPRDLRGQLRVTPAGFEGLLPGVVCRGTLQPFAVSCAADRAAWPIGLDNEGVAPSRNFFMTPEGLLFYGAAPLGPSGPARWLVADSAGALAFLDGSRRLIAPAAPATQADDVVGIHQACAPGTFVIATARSVHASTHDDLRLFAVNDTTLTDLAALSMPGTVTALWAPPGARAATAIVHSPGSSRYEAHQISLACAR
jgi:hypothetical protein